MVVNDDGNYGFHDFEERFMYSNQNVNEINTHIQFCFD